MLTDISDERHSSIVQLSRHRTAPQLLMWCAQAIISRDDALTLLLVQEMARRMSIPGAMALADTLSMLRGRAAAFAAADDAEPQLPDHHLVLLDPAATYVVAHHAHHREEVRAGLVELSPTPEVHLASMLIRFRPLLRKARRGGFGVEGDWYSSSAGLRHWTLVCVPVWGSGKVAGILCFVVNTTIAHAEMTGKDVSIAV